MEIEIEMKKKDKRKMDRLLWAGVMLGVLGVGPAAGGPGATTRPTTTLPAAATRPAPTSQDAERLALRRSAMVKVFEDCKDSVVCVAITQVGLQPATRPASDPGKDIRVTQVQWGTGWVLHEGGFLLTNSHALRLAGEQKVTFQDGRSYPFRVVATDTGNDLALLRIRGRGPLKPLKLGRSGDLMVGERAATLGNPFGMGLTMGSGILTALGRATKTEYTTLSDMIQTDAGINPGSSGGPLLNIFGEVIGVVTCQKTEGEGIGFATPIDKVRALLPEMISAEERYGFVLGMMVATDGPAEVSQVVQGSPAQAAGVRAGDLVVGVGEYPIRRGIDFYLALVDRQPGQRLGLKLLREGKLLESTVVLGKAAFQEAAKVTGLAAGLDWKAYRDRWVRLPDFSRLKPAAAGMMPTFGLEAYKDTDDFALEISGYVDIPADGIYAFYTRSDDGSRLWVGPKLVVDNDGLHAALEKRGFAALKAGKHPIRVAFFEAGGDDELEVSYEGPGLRKQPIPAKALFRVPRATPQPATRPLGDTRPVRRR